MSSAYIMNYLTQNDLKLLEDFIGEPAIPDRVIQKLSRTRISSACAALASDVPHNILARSLILLEIAALESNTFSKHNVDGYSISVRTSGDLKTNIYIEVNNVPVIQMVEEWDGDYDWSVLFVNPNISYNNYALEAILKACAKARKNGWY